MKRKAGCGDIIDHDHGQALEVPILRSLESPGYVGNTFNVAFKFGLPVCVFGTQKDIFGIESPFSFILERRQAVRERSDRHLQSHSSKKVPRRHPRKPARAGFFPNLTDGNGAFHRTFISHRHIKRQIRIRIAVIRV